MKYLFIGGSEDGSWNEVPTGCAHADVVPKGATTNERYTMQAWSANGKVLHRVFVYELTPDQTFVRMMQCYRADKPGLATRGPYCPDNFRPCERMCLSTCNIQAERARATPQT